MAKAKRRAAAPSTDDVYADASPAEIAAMRAHGWRFVASFVGPTGSGKTALAAAEAARHQSFGYDTRILEAKDGQADYLWRRPTAASAQAEQAASSR
jgi:polynucleotide 5'-kinase involved in rRNA processing